MWLSKDMVILLCLWAVASACLGKELGELRRALSIYYITQTGSFIDLSQGLMACELLCCVLVMRCAGKTGG